MTSLPPRARVLTAVVVLSNVAGNALLSMGMKNAPSVVSAIISPAVIIGVALLILWMLSRVALMSWADLSYVLPVTALGYVLTTAVGAALLHEHVTATRWIATLLIVLGTVLAGITAPKTTPERRDQL